MSEIQIFNNQEFGEIRTIVINDEPWFVGKDVATALGYVKAPNMLKLVDDDDKRNISSSDLEQQVYKQSYTISLINESGLYAAIFGSKQENAKKFKKWVTSEVLPQIRRTGSYGKNHLPMTTQEQIKLLAQGNVELSQKVEVVGKKVNELSDRFEKSFLELPVLGVEADRINGVLRYRAIECMGGKDSAAYRNADLRKRIFWDIHIQLRREFQVNSYKAIRRNQVDAAVKFLNEYRLPLALKEEVEQVNNQSN